MVQIPSELTVFPGIDFIGIHLGEYRIFGTVADKRSGYIPVKGVRLFLGCFQCGFFLFHVEICLDGGTVA